MLNYSMWQHDPADEKKRIVTISYKIGSYNRFKNMTNAQKEALVDMITRFETTLAASKKEIKESIGK